MLMGAVAVIVIIVLIVGAYYLTKKGPSGTTTQTTTVVPTTTAIGGSTTALTTSTATTTIVSNLTTATGPNLASCNGYNYTQANALVKVVGSCGWSFSAGSNRPMNFTIYGGAFTNASIMLSQQNVTYNPFSLTFGAGACKTVSAVNSIPIGSYKVSFITGSAASGNATKCGSATLRISH